MTENNFLILSDEEKLKYENKKKIFSEFIETFFNHLNINSSHNSKYCPYTDEKKRLLQKFSLKEILQDDFLDFFEKYFYVFCEYPLTIETISEYKDSISKLNIEERKEVLKRAIDYSNKLNSRYYSTHRARISVYSYVITRAVDFILGLDDTLKTFVYNIKTLLDYGLNLEFINFEDQSSIQSKFEEAIKTEDLETVELTKSLWKPILKRDFEKHLLLLDNPNILDIEKVELIKKHFLQSDLPKYLEFLASCEDLEILDMFIETSILNNTRINAQQKPIKIGELFRKIFIVEASRHSSYYNNDPVHLSNKRWREEFAQKYCYYFRDKTFTERFYRDSVSSSRRGSYNKNKEYENFLDKVISLGKIEDLVEFSHYNGMNLIKNKLLNILKSGGRMMKNGFSSLTKQEEYLIVKKFCDEGTLFESSPSNKDMMKDFVLKMMKIYHNEDFFIEFLRKSFIIGNFDNMNPQLILDKYNRYSPLTNYLYDKDKLNIGAYFIWSTIASKYDEIPLDLKESLFNLNDMVDYLGLNLDFFSSDNYRKDSYLNYFYSSKNSNDFVTAQAIVCRNTVDLWYHTLTNFLYNIWGNFSRDFELLGNNNTEEFKEKTLKIIKNFFEVFEGEHGEVIFQDLVGAAAQNPFKLKYEFSDKYSGITNARDIWGKTQEYLSKGIEEVLYDIQKTLRFFYVDIMADKFNESEYSDRFDAVNEVIKTSISSINLLNAV